VDEPLTGRSYDGENYNIGILTVTDTPYPELVTAARAIHRQAYARHAGKP
jgi:agarase